MRRERLADDSTATGHYVKHVSRQDMVTQVGDTDHREGRGFARFQHDRVADGESRRDFAACVDGRPVERDDGADYPEWLQHRGRVDAAGVVKVATG